MRRLSGAHEHLDGGLSDRAALIGNLRDLERINRRFGGTALSMRAVRALVGSSAPVGVLHVLDVGTGAADMPLAMMRATGAWRTVRVTAIDSRQEVIDAALALHPRLPLRAAMELGVADGRRLPYADATFDVAHASLVLHHLEPPAALELLRELRRVSRLGVVINDLARGRLNWLGAWLVLHAMTRNRFTLHDGPLSVRRAYTRAEARELVREAGLRPLFEAVGFAGHRWAIAAVRP